MKRKYTVTFADASTTSVVAEAVVNNEGYLSFYNTVPAPPESTAARPAIELVEIMAPESKWVRVRNEGPEL